MVQSERYCVRRHCPKSLLCSLGLAYGRGQRGRRRGWMDSVVVRTAPAAPGPRLQVLQGAEGRAAGVRKVRGRTRHVCRRPRRSAADVCPRVRVHALAQSLSLKGHHQPVGRLPLRLPFFGSLSPGK